MRRKKRALDKTEVTTFTVLLPLRNNQFVICQLADNRFDGTTKLCRRPQTSMPVGNLVAPRIFRMRAHKNGHLLSLAGDLRLETLITWIGFYGEPIPYEREFNFRWRYLNDMLGAGKRRPKRFRSGSFIGKALQPQIHRLYCAGWASDGRGRFRKLWLAFCKHFAKRISAFHDTALPHACRTSFSISRLTSSMASRARS